MYDAQQLGIVLIGRLVETQHLLVVALLMGLVEYTQHTIQSVARPHTETGYLNNDAIVRQTIYKRIGQSLCHHTTVIVVRLAAHIQHRLLDVAHLMPQQVYRHHGNGVSTTPLRLHVLFIGILRTKILAEAKRLRRQPRLLQFYEHQMLTAVLLTHGGTEVDAEY